MHLILEDIGNRGWKTGLVGRRVGPGETGGLLEEELTLGKMIQCGPGEGRKTRPGQCHDLTIRYLSYFLPC